MSYYLGLIGLGLFFVLLIHLYNRWTLYKFRQYKKQQIQDPPNSRESLSNSATGATIRRSKPFITGSHSTFSPNTSTAFIAKQPEKNTKAFTSNTSETSDTTPPPFTIEYPFVIQEITQCTEAEILSWLQRIKKASSYINTIALMDKNHQWEIIWQHENHHSTASLTSLPFSPVAEAEITVLLANRSGYITLEELQNLQTLFESLKQTKSKKRRQTKPPPLAKLAKCAKEIDRWCASYDVQIVLTLACRNPAGISGGQISHESAQAGMIFEQGIFLKNDDEGHTLFTLEFSPSAEMPKRLEDMENRIAQQVTLYLDVPRVAHAKTVFEEMTAFAQHLAAVIHADLVDDHMQHLSTTSLETIGQQIEQIQLSMKSSGINPGSKNALKLFS